MEPLRDERRLTCVRLHRFVAPVLLLALVGCGRQDASPPPDPTVVTRPSTTSTTATTLEVEAEQSCTGLDGPAIDVTVRGHASTPFELVVLVDDVEVATAPADQTLVEVPSGAATEDATVEVRAVETGEVLAATDVVEPFGVGGGCG